MNTLVNICGYSLISKDTVRFVLSDCSSSIGLSKPEVTGFEFYPSPTKNLLTLEFDASFENNFSSIAIFNHAGQKIISKPINHNMEYVDVSKLSPGIYIINIYSGENSAVRRRFIKN